MFQKIIDLVLNFFDTEEKKVTYNVVNTEYKNIKSEEVLNSYYKIEPREQGFYSAETNLKTIKAEINKKDLPHNKLSEDLITTLKSYHGVEHQILWNLEVEGSKIECLFITPFKIFLFTTKYIHCDFIKNIESETWEYHYGKTIHTEENPLTLNREKKVKLSKFLNVNEDSIEEIVIFVSTGTMEKEQFSNNLVFLNSQKVNMLKSLLFFRIEEEHMLTFTNEEILNITEKLFNFMK